MLRVAIRLKGKAVQESVSSGLNSAKARTDFMQLVSATHSLTSTLEKAHRVACIFGTQTWDVVCALAVVVPCLLLQMEISCVQASFVAQTNQYSMFH